MSHAWFPEPEEADLPPGTLARIDAACDQFELGWQADSPPRIEDQLACWSGAERLLVLRELLEIELGYRRQRGDTVDPSEYASRFPDVPDLLELVFAAPDASHAIDTVAGTTPTAVEPTQHIAHFELLEPLGSGAFGTVWKAHDTRLDRIVAVKVPRAAILDPLEQEQFLREARAAAQLRHPHIVQVYEIEQDRSSVHIVSEWIDGISLAQAMEQRTLTIPESAAICEKLAYALQHAHDRRVIHRDLKPSNVMLDKQGEPHLTDFGLAKRESGEITLTLHGQIMGTPAYMSPEQARGAGHTVDGRTDIYALGTMLFQLLTGELPFRGDTPAILQQVLHMEPPSARAFRSDIPRDLATICAKCMGKLPQHRYDTAQQLAEDLGRYRRGEPILARPISTTVRLARWCQRQPMTATVVALAAILALCVGPIMAWRESNHARSIADKNTELDANTKRLQRELAASQTPLAVPSTALRILLDRAWQQTQSLGPNSDTPWSSADRLYHDGAIAMLAPHVKAPTVAQQHLQRALDTLNHVTTSVARDPTQYHAMRVHLETQLARSFRQTHDQTTAERFRLRAVEHLIPLMARSDDDTGSPISDRYRSLRQQLELLAIESAGGAELSALQALAPTTGPSHPAEEAIDEDLATLRDRIRRYEDQVHSARSSSGSVTRPDLFQLASDYARLGRLQRAAGARPESVVSFVTSIDYFQQSPHELVKDRSADRELRAAYDDLVAVAREIESPSSTVTRALEHELRWPVSAPEMYHLAARLTNETPWLLEDDIRE